MVFHLSSFWFSFFFVISLASANGHSVVSDLKLQLETNIYRFISNPQKNTTNCFISQKTREELLLDAQQLLESVSHFSSLEEVYSAKPLFGWVTAVKDNIDTADMITTAGTRGLSQNLPKTDAPIVQQLRDAGALIAGKANLHELGFGTTCDNRCFGFVKNPYHALDMPEVELIPGGSSGGSAVAVAVDAVRVALGTDTSGSGRIPASLTGIFGFRPTMGRYSAQGIFPLSSMRDTATLFSKTIEDIIAVDQVITQEATVPQLEENHLWRVGIPSYFWRDLHPETERIARETIQLFKNAGIVVTEFDIDSQLLNHEMTQIFQDVIMYEYPRDQETYLRTHESDITLNDVWSNVCGRDVQQVLEKRLQIDEERLFETYQYAITELRPQLQKAFFQVFTNNSVDFILYPTTPLPASPTPPEQHRNELFHNGRIVNLLQTYIQNTDASSITGMPSISFPAGKTDQGLPVNMELAGLWSTDKTLLTFTEKLMSLFN